MKNLREGERRGGNFFFSPRLTPTWTQDKNFHPIGRRTGNKFPVEKRKKGKKNYAMDTALSCHITVPYRLGEGEVVNYVIERER